jgi:hypothetical protein
VTVTTVTARSRSESGGGDRVGLAGVTGSEARRRLGGGLEPGRARGPADSVTEHRLAARARAAAREATACQ